MRSFLFLICGVAIGAAGVAGYPHFAASLNQPYANQHDRQISSLSASDIKQIEAGQGWGLAKPAEFNGYPGPLHVLELADKLDLTADQKATVEQIFATMRSQAIKHGKDLIEAEARLDEAFKNQQVNPQLLRERLDATEAARARLRAVHLSAHLEVTPLLTASQKEKYETLRGYGSGHAGHTGH